MNGIFAESVVMMIVGLGGVFASLLFFSALIWLMKKVDKLIFDKPKKEIAETIVKEEEISQELIAVFAAAAMEFFHKPVRIRRVQFLSQPNETSWAQSGRLSIMGSHNIQIKK